MLFADPFSLQEYLPAVGLRPLTNDLVKPITTPSGSFGGEVVALKLNVDFEGVGLLPGSSATPFGDLILENLNTCQAANGLMVRRFLGDVNAALSDISRIADEPPGELT